MPDERWLASLTAFGLPGAPEIEPTDMPIDELLTAVRAHKLIGVLAAAFAEGCVNRPADGARIAAAHEAAMRESLLLEEMLLQAVAVLADEGIGYRVLKGAALAHRVHPDPAERTFGDNDLILAPADIDRGVAALVAAGASRPVPPLSPDFDRRFAKSVTLRWRGPTELDIHRTLAPGPYGHLITLDDLARDPATFTIAGVSLHTLPVDLHLLHGAIHVALGDVDARLGNVRDLALLAARTDVDADEVVGQAAAWGCTAPLAVGLRATASLGHDRTSIERWADTYEIGSTDRRRLAAYASREGRYRRQALASLRVLSWRDRLGFARALLRPSAANRAARDRGRQPGASPRPRGLSPSIAGEGRGTAGGRAVGSVSTAAISWARSGGQPSSVRASAGPRDGRVDPDAGHGLDPTGGSGARVGPARDPAVGSVVGAGNQMEH